MAAGGLAKKPASYEDLERVPPHLVAELLDGQLHTTPRPALRHARVATVLGSEIVGPFDRGRGGPGGWFFLSNLSCTCTRTLWYPTWPVGAVPGFRPSPTLLF